MKESKFDEVPTLDMRRFDTDRDAFISDIGDAYKNFGFCCFSNHGISQNLIDESYRAFKDFFALPTSTKEKYFIKGKAGSRGYTPFKIETAKDQNIADLKEFWHVGRDGAPGLMPNIWPDEVPHFKKAASEIYQDMERVGDKVLSAMALYLQLPEDYFKDVVSGGDTILRALHYPPVDPKDLPAVRAGAHEDIDLITLLVGATDGGLEVLTSDNTWLPIRAKENTLVVNIGDMLQRLSNHVFKSTTHRVVNPSSSKMDKPRFSMPFFIHPNPSFLIKTLPQCITDENPDRYPEPITSQEFLNQRLKEIKLI